MSKKTLLITGCSPGGIGYDCAHHMRRAGWQVFASCRKEADCATLRDEGFESPRIDLAETASIESGLAEVLAVTGGTLGALFNNAAFAVPGAVEDLPTDGLRSAFETNVFGTHELTRRVIPIMRAQGHGRVVQNSSVLGFAALRWRGAYNSTKFALEGLTDTLRIEMRDTPIHVVTIEPGPITSKIRVNSIPHFERWIDWENSARADQYRDQLRPRLYEGAEDKFELPASAVSHKLLLALTAYRPKAHYMITKPTYMMAIFKRILPVRMLDWISARL